MHLLVGIDTEGDNQWDAAARTHQTFENIYALPRLHTLFARHGVRPTYVVTHPVATDPRSADLLRRLLEGGDCEIGAHHHAWETPPCTPDDVRRHAYASTLPRPQFEDQLAALTSAIEAAVDKVIAANPQKVEQAKAKPSLAGWFVGQVMKETGGKANPQAVNELLKKKLEI